MPHELNFNLDTKQLLEIACQLEQQIQEGMSKDNQEIRCLITHIPVSHLPKQGKALVLDFGGTNMRAAVVILKDGKIQFKTPPSMDALPIKRGVTMDRESFLKFQAHIISLAQPDEGLPLGYCFSFPAETMENGDARPVRWTKGIAVHNTLGEPIGDLLLDYLKKQDPGLSCSHVAVINDTVASLLGALGSGEADARIGLIVGTGCNMAILADEKSVPKWSKPEGWKGELPVNLESGNLHPSYLTKWDDQIDRESENPGKQRFEKAVSGAYQGRIFKAVYPDSKIDVDEGSAGLVRLLQAGDTPPEQVKLAQTLLDRSAKLVAASLLGVILFLNRSYIRKKVHIVGEGSLIQKAGGYKKMLEKTLNHLLVTSDLKKTEIEILDLKDPNLTGSAIAALSLRQ